MSARGRAAAAARELDSTRWNALEPPRGAAPGGPGARGPAWAPQSEPPGPAKELRGEREAEAPAGPHSARPPFPRTPTRIVTAGPGFPGGGPLGSARPGGGRPTGPAASGLAAPTRPRLRVSPRVLPSRAPGAPARGPWTRPRAAVCGHLRRRRPGLAASGRPASGPLHRVAACAGGALPRGAGAEPGGASPRGPPARRGPAPESQAQTSAFRPLPRARAQRSAPAIACPGPPTPHTLGSRARRVHGRPDPAGRAHPRSPARRRPPCTPLGHR